MPVPLHLPDDPAALYLHVRVLLGMVVGLGLTHLLRNFARIIDHPARKVYWVHLVWAVSMFVYLLHFWWWQFLLSMQQQWTFGLYVFVTLYALLLYLLCAVIFPDALDRDAGYEDYYFSRRGWFFGLLALAYLVDIGDTWLKGPAYMASLGAEYFARNAAYVALCVIAIFNRNRRFHAVFAVAALVSQLVFIARHYDTI